LGTKNPNSLRELLDDLSQAGLIGLFFSPAWEPVLDKRGVGWRWVLVG